MRLNVKDNKGPGGYLVHDAAETMGRREDILPGGGGGHVSRRLLKGKGEREGGGRGGGDGGRGRKRKNKRIT